MLYGRDPERAIIGQLLDAARESRSDALVLRGEPGVGKTALLDDARERAADMQVLTARGVDSESELPFAALHQLLRPALGAVNALPPPQAAALRRALGLADGDPPELFLIFAACLSLLAELAERRPVLCLVDDAHWLDQASADAIRFVARRLEAEGIALLLAAREGDVRRFDADDIASLALDGLDVEAAEALVAQGAAVAPAVRPRLVALTHGNALALVELPKALNDEQLAGTAPLPDALPMTRQLEGAFTARVERLPAPARRLLLVAAADDSEDLALVGAAAAAVGADSRELDSAERAGLIEIRGSRLAFRHPLVRSAVYSAATSSERRAAHRALADALAGDDGQADRRAWHLSAWAIDHDEGVVGELDRAARRAEERGGQIAAARALQRAAELSTDSRGRRSRFVRAASNMSSAGRDEEAVLIAGRAGDVRDDPPLRARVAVVGAVAAIRRRGRPHETVAELIDAARELAGTAPTEAVNLLILAATAGWQGGDQSWVTAVADSAGAIPPDALDADARALAASLAGYEAMARGDFPEGARLLRETMAWGGRVEEPRFVLWASWAAVWLGEDDSFQALLDRAARHARARGEIGVLAETLGVRASHLSMNAQRFGEAAVAATEAAELARQLGAENLALLPRAALSVVAAIHGQGDDARAHARSVIEPAREKGLRMRASPAIYALALDHMNAGAWDAAFEQLALVTDPSDPSVPFTLPDRVEAAVRAGRPDDARAAVAAYETWAAYSGAPSAPPRLASCRALVTEGEEAAAHFGEAIELVGDARPFDRHRIHLLAGEHLRRERRRTEARAHLRAALDGFEAMGAQPWAERARAELRATGETARRRDPSAASQLTPQERQIARLVAEGMTNKEIAAQLYLSPRTIESHLRKAFVKLGVTSRTQLARVALGDPD